MVLSLFLFSAGRPVIDDFIVFAFYVRIPCAMLRGRNFCLCSDPNDCGCNRRDDDERGRSSSLSFPLIIESLPTSESSTQVFSSLYLQTGIKPLDLGVRRNCAVCAEPFHHLPFYYPKHHIESPQLKTTIIWLDLVYWSVESILFVSKSFSI